MRDLPDNEATLLVRAAAALGVELSEAETSALVHYLDLLERWNKVYNLTAVRTRPQMLVQHVLDCLAVVPPLQREFPGAGTLIDVGSGAGLPAVVIAICRPDLQVVSVDAVDKKVRFVAQVAAQLKLPNLVATHSRIEDLDRTANVVTSRAFSSLEDFVRLTKKLLLPDGIWMAMKGKSPEAELAALPADVHVFHVEQLQVPELVADRCIVWLRHAAASHTPSSSPD